MKLTLILSLMAAALALTASIVDAAPSASLEDEEATELTAEEQKRLDAIDHKTMLPFGRHRPTFLPVLLCTTPKVLKACGGDIVMLLKLLNSAFGDGCVCICSRRMRHARFLARAKPYSI
jgi:hypothetical protein